MKNILISTGGSGGHVVPATIFYEHLENKYNVFLTSDERGLKFLNEKKYDVEIINVKRISKNIFLLPFQLFSLFCLIIKSFFFLKRKKIEILISTGGYMSLPLCIASRILNIKLFLFEPNMVLGRCNKFFINSCVKIFCYSEKILNFPERLKNKICLASSLLRKEFYTAKKSEDMSKEINLLIIGGSQGAELFDTIIGETIVNLSKNYKIKVFQQTSLKNNQNLKKFYLKNNIENELFDFEESVINFMSRSNICITRAGASTLAELVYLTVPHIAIPLPSARDNHQFENALFYKNLNCSWILNQNEFNHANLNDKIVNIIENKVDYLEKKRNMKNFNFQNTWNNINQKIITTINEN